MTRLVVLGLACLLMPRLAFAQLCEGQPALDATNARLSPSAAFASNTRLFGVGLGGGHEAAYGDVGFGVINADAADSNGYAILGHLASDHAIDVEHRVHVCPLGSVSYTWGPNIVGLSTHQAGVNIGGSLGVNVPTNSQSFQFVPTVGVTYDYVHTRLSVENNGPTAATSANFGQLGIGAGLIFNHRTGLFIGGSFPFALSGAQNEFVVSLTYNFRE